MPTITAYVHAYVPVHNAGAETTIHDVLKHLVGNGWEANVVIKPPVGYQATKIKKDSYQIDGVNVHYAEDKRTLLHYLPKSDLTISHLESSERTHMLSEKYRIPSIHLVHNTHPLTVRWMSHATALIINTDWIANEPEFASWNGPKMVLNPPVNPDDYRTDHGKAVTLVNLWEDKGSKVFYELAKRFPKVPFIGVKGGYGEQVIEDLQNVTIMDHTPDIKSVYGQTRVLLMPSKYESFGRVGVEAMASGIPVLAEPTPGLKESLGAAGTFADRDDIDAWETALKSMLTPVKYGKLSKAALAQSKALEAKREAQLFQLDAFVNELTRIKRAR